MRLPPRQSTAEADLMVPFQLVLLVDVIFCLYVAKTLSMPACSAQCEIH